MTLDDIKMMQSHDLLEMGIDNLSARIAIMRAAKRMHSTSTIGFQAQEIDQRLLQDFMFQIHNYR